MTVGFSPASLFFFATTSLSLCAIAADADIGQGRPWPRYRFPPPHSCTPFPPSPDEDDDGGYIDRRPAGRTPPHWADRGGLASGGGGGASCSCSRSNIPPLLSPQVIMVGGDKKWSFGTNYTDWVTKAGTFYVNDVLEFDYPLPMAQRSNHSVHLLKDYASFQRCNLSGSVRVGNEYAGGSQGGFKFQLGMKPVSEAYYYFACGEKDGFNCNRGTMKFAVMPILRWE